MNYISTESELCSGLYRFEAYGLNNGALEWTEPPIWRLVVDVNRKMVLDVNPGEMTIHYIVGLTDGQRHVNRILSFMPQMILWRANRGINQCQGVRLIANEISVPARHVRRVEL